MDGIQRLTTIPRLLGIGLFILSISAGFSVGKIYAETLQTAATVVATATAQASAKVTARAKREHPFPNSADKLREMAIDMMRAEDVSNIEPAAGQ